ncbi:exodeoxyribonuclease VII small subunit [Synechococcus sp. ATX 2A4]|uniref:exodeoxyribonuclease VII small subunit n=1 Tax=Synechococcus sp. ATX 2A4 TaxID=2823727 RepID=UPI0020CE8845|nr:exodeoxyribonuclease VII small subunit [Synechococcus sp. ATX 2A4]MCP9885741.1 exodeoxyribonuclease VII small subunit [Synechococcus sp. ATX 2A4]
MTTRKSKPLAKVATGPKAGLPPSWAAEVAELTYSQALTALELSLAQLQSEDLEVEKMAELYQRALAYGERCEAVLQQVEQEVLQLEVTELDQATTTPFTETLP